MQFKGLYTPHPKTEEEFFIRHVDEHGTILAYVVDKNGVRLDDGYLCRFNKNGIYRFTGVNPKFGFPLDENGRIKDLPL
jgi:hypothetical protein